MNKPTKTSQIQIEANRRNAQKSTGPSTTKGKIAVAQNALKHGLRTDRTVIKSEDQADFDLHHAQIFDELAPSTPIESALADRIVSTLWRLKRVENFQNRSIDALGTPKNNQFTKLQQMLIAKYTGSSEAGSVESDPDLLLGRMLVKDFTNDRVLEKLLMYERRIENSFYRSLLEIHRLNMIKKIQAQESNIV
jgi:hypothetical protein